MPALFLISLTREQHATARRSISLATISAQRENIDRLFQDSAAAEVTTSFKAMIRFAELRYHYDSQYTLSRHCVEKVKRYLVEQRRQKIIGREMNTLTQRNESAKCCTRLNEKHIYKHLIQSIVYDIYEQRRAHEILSA